MFHRSITFRKKLFTLFVLSVILPLILVGFLIFQTIKAQYRDVLSSFFEQTADLHQQIIVDFLENNRSLVRSLSSQSTLIEELIKHANGEKDLNTDDLFFSLDAIRSENQFISKISILDRDGKVFVSTMTDELGNSFHNAPFYKIPVNREVAYIGRSIFSSIKEKVIPIATPCFNRKDGSVVGVLVLELRSSAFKTSFRKRVTQPFSGESIDIENYIIDRDGLPITTIENIKQESDRKIDIHPVQVCNQQSSGAVGTWKNYLNQEVFGVSRCIKIDDLQWTLITEQATAEVFKISDQLGRVILLIVVILALVSIFVVTRISNSITTPVQVLSAGAREIGKGNLDFRFNIKSGDELGRLARSFKRMANRLKNYISVLRKKDKDLTIINKKLKKEKAVIVAEKKKLDFVIKGINDAVIATDLNKRIILVNKAAENLLGRSSKVLLGKLIEEVFDLFEEDKKIEIKNCFSNKRVREGVVFDKKGLKLVRKRDERQLIVNLIAGKVEKGEKIGLGCILTLHDTTKESELEKMRTDFMTIASHQLRTPLTIVNWHVEMLLDEDVGKVNKNQQKYLTIAQEGVRRMTKLVSDLLSISRIERNKISKKPTIINVEGLIKEVIRKVELSFKGRSICQIKLKKLKQKLSKGLVDPVLIKQALINLVVNAIDYSVVKKGCSVDIELQEVGSKSGKLFKKKEKAGFLMISIKDQGIGIAKKDQKRIFEKFFRTDTAKKVKADGTGIGLYIVKCIIQSSGGRVWFKSEEGKGSTFYVTIPIAKS